MDFGPTTQCFIDSGSIFIDTIMITQGTTFPYKTIIPFHIVLSLLQSTSMVQCTSIQAYLVDYTCFALDRIEGISHLNQ